MEYRRNMVSGGSSIAVKTPTQAPNLSGIGSACPKNTLFSYFIPTHRNAAFELKRILMGKINYNYNYKTAISQISVYSLYFTI